MQLQIIGEMAKKLDENSMREIDVPWKMIIGLRNMISHDYFLLELNTIMPADPAVRHADRITGLRHRALLTCLCRVWLDNGAHWQVVS